MDYITELAERVKTLTINNDVLIKQNKHLLNHFVEPYGDGYYEGFIDGAKYQSTVDINLKTTTGLSKIEDEAMRCSEIAELTITKRLGIVSRQDMMTQITELVAQAAKLKELACYWINQSEPKNASKQEYNTWQALGHNSNAMAATPTQHLRQIQADAGKAGWLECEKWFYYTDTDPDECLAAADQYAARVKAGE